MEIKQKQAIKLVNKLTEGNLITQRSAKAIINKIGKSNETYLDKMISALKDAVNTKEKNITKSKMENVVKGLNYVHKEHKKQEDRKHTTLEQSQQKFLEKIKKREEKLKRKIQEIEKEYATMKTKDKKDAEKMKKIRKIITQMKEINDDIEENIEVLYATGNKKTNITYDTQYNYMEYKVKAHRFYIEGKKDDWRQETVIIKTKKTELDAWDIAKIHVILEKELGEMYEIKNVEFENGKWQILPHKKMDDIKNGNENLKYSFLSDIKGLFAKTETD